VTGFYVEKKQRLGLRHSFDKGVRRAPKQLPRDSWIHFSSCYSVWRLRNEQQSKLEDNLKSSAGVMGREEADIKKRRKRRGKRRTRNKSRSKR
jgi:hypothetical protein